MDLVEEDEASPYYYTEDAHPPAFHAFAAVKASKDNGSATPLVIVDGDKVIAKSDTICQKFLPQLYPNEKVKGIEEDLGNCLGATVRLYAYHHLLQDGYYKALCKICCPDSSKIENKMFATMLPNGINKSMRKIMGINAESAATCQKVIREVFDEYSKILENQEYIVAGETFTAADLTFASLSSPLLRPPELVNFQVSDDEIPADVLRFANELRATKAGQHVLKVYAKYRSKTPEQRVVVKTTDRDRMPWPEIGLAVGSVAVCVGVGIQLFS